MGLGVYLNKNFGTAKHEFYGEYEIISVKYNFGKYHNRILLNDNNFSTNGDIRIHDLSIKNADNPILEQNDTISISLEYTNCIWADNINQKVDYDITDISLLPNLGGNSEFNREKDLVFKINTDQIPGNYNELEPFFISELYVSCEDVSQDNNNKIKLRNYEQMPDNEELNLSFYGLDTKQTNTDVVEIDIPDNSAVWMDGSAKFIFDSLYFNDSELFINDSLSFYLDFGDQIKFRDIDAINDIIDVSGFVYTSITTNSDSTKLGFLGVSDSPSDSLFRINNLLLNINSDIYQENNFPISENLKLVIPNPDETDNFVKSDNQFDFLPSLFFSTPSLYHDLSSDESFMEFCVYNPWNMSDDDTLYFDINKNYVPLFDDDLDKVDDIPSNISDNFADYDIFSDSNLELWTFDLNANVLDSINVIIDSLNVNNEEVSISIFKDYTDLGLSRSNSSDNNDSQLSFYPGIDPVSEYLFTNDSRAINPNLDAITMQPASGNQYTPEIKIQSLYEQSDNYEINDWGDEMTYSDGLITIDMPMISNNLDDGIYSMSIYVRDPSTRAEKSSIPLSRYYYLDRSAPDIFDIAPWDGLSNEGMGHDITIHDDILITLIDSSIYFDDENNSIDHILNGQIDSLNLNHIFSNENYVKMEFYLNDIKIEGRDVLDTLEYGENHLSDYEIILQNTLSGLEYEAESEFKIMLEARDQANNLRTHEVAYTIQKNEEDMLSHFINYPNPFSPFTNEQTYFRYSIVKQNTKGNLVVYDLSGNLIYLRELDSNELTLGTHEIAWDGRTNAGLILADGVYFALIDFDGNRTRVHKVAVINEK